MSVLIAHTAQEIADCVKKEPCFNKHSKNAAEPQSRVFQDLLQFSHLRMLALFSVDSEVTCRIISTS